MLADGLQHHQAGRLAEAEAIYKNLLAKDRRHSDALHLLGLVEKQRGNLDSAAGLIRQAMATRPGEAIYHSNLGTVLQAQGRLDDAIDCYQRAVTLKPDYADAHNNLGGGLAARGRVAEAIASYESSLQANPGDARTHNNLGLTLAADGQLEAAITHYQQAVALQPGFADAFNNLGNAFQGRDRLDDAIACYRQALAVDPTYVTAYNNLGNTLQAQHRMAAALTCYDQALAIKPDYAQARFGKALTQLLLGNFLEGWQSFEWRWRTPDHIPMRTYPQPLWKGEPLPAGRLLVWGEQGVGDEVMFAGLLPNVLRTGTRCILDCEPRLRPLFARSFPDLEVVSGCDPDAGIGAHLPSGSLPGLFRNSRQAFASTTSPYLKADPESVAALRSRYVDSGPRSTSHGRAIGLAWHTNNRKTGPRRSLDLALLKPLFALQDILWVSLQYGSHEALEEQVAAAGVPLLVDHTVDQLADIDLFAAQIAALDLVITIDNSTAHLAGALGVAVWLLLPYAADWRWLQSGQDSPWYPGMRLFRQPALGDWPSVIDEVVGEL